MKLQHLLALLFLFLVVVAGCGRTDATSEADPACKRACNEANTRCRAACDEPTACGARCDDEALRCLARCAR